MEAKKPPSITGSRVLDITLQKEGSRAWRVFWRAVGNDAARRKAAKPAWDGLDPFLLPDDVFADDFDFLARAIYDEQKAHVEHARRLKALVPTAAAPDAETLVPGPAEQTLTTDITLRDAQRLLELEILEDDAPPNAQLFAAIPAGAVVEESPPPRKPQPPPSNDFIRQKAEEAAQQKADEVPKQLVLPSVAEPERTAPTLWLRSAIFGVVGRGQREDRRMHALPTPWVKGQLYFTGIQLAQDDLDVLLQMLHMAASQGGPGQEIHFNDRGMMKALRRSYGTKTLEWLDEVAHRLMAAVIVLDDGEGTQAQFHLVRSYVRNAKTGQRAFVVDPEVMKFFGDGGGAYTVLQWEHRLALDTGLSKWLHGFLMSQPSTANGVTLALLKELSGVASSRPIRKFRADLKTAIAEVEGLNDPHLGLESIEIVEGKAGPKLVWTRRKKRHRLE